MGKVGKICLILIVSLPVAAIGTLITFPFWNWFEGVTSIESMGHSGPAEWCFVFVYVLCVGVGFFAMKEKSTT